MKTNYYIYVIKNTSACTFISQFFPLILLREIIYYVSEVITDTDQKSRQKCRESYIVEIISFMTETMKITWMHRTKF